jgi:hypothetical protein
LLDGLDEQLAQARAMMSLVMLICLFMIIRALHVHYSFRPARKALDEQHTTAGRTNSSRRTHSTFFPNMAHESTQQATFSPLGYHNLRMNGLQNSSPNDPRKRNPFTWVAENNQSHPHAVSFVSLTIFLLHFEMLYIGSGFFYLFCLRDQDGKSGMEMEMEMGERVYTFPFKNNWN